MNQTDDQPLDLARPTALDTVIGVDPAMPGGDRTAVMVMDLDQRGKRAAAALNAADRSRGIATITAPAPVRSPTPYRPKRSKFQRRMERRELRNNFPKGGRNLPATAGDNTPTRVEAVQEKYLYGARVPTIVLHPSGRGRPMTPDQLVRLASRNRRRRR